ncbi:MAG: hypothetical protein HYU29_06770 [Chloroflexi bacterium]|nr:hypothetical protein [Chloroflexota bacterium]
MSRGLSKDPGNLARRLFHVGAGSFTPVLAFFLPRPWVLALAGLVALLLVIGELTRFAFPVANLTFRKWLGFLLKPGEEGRVTAATYMALATVMALILFSQEIAALGVLFLSLGDPAASVVGRRFGRWRVGAKSLEGSLAFLAVALVVAGAYYFGGRAERYWPLAVGSVVAAMVELLPLPVDDNLWVPLAAGGAMALLGA